jgi:transcriptional regulator with XRE-family HTH domain
MKKEPVRQTLRRNIVEARAARGLSQTQLAKKAGLSRPVVSGLEQARANPTLSVLEKLGGALGCTISALLGAKPPAISLAPTTLKHRNKLRTGTRFSRAGRKPSYKTWLSNPPPGSKTAEAQDFGIDLTLLAQTLRRSASQRFDSLQQGADGLRWLKAARPVIK